MSDEQNPTETNVSIGSGRRPKEGNTPNLTQEIPVVEAQPEEREVAPQQGATQEEEYRHLNPIETPKPKKEPREPRVKLSKGATIASWLTFPASLVNPRVREAFSGRIRETFHRDEPKPVNQDGSKPRFSTKQKVIAGIVGAGAILGLGVAKSWSDSNDTPRNGDIDKSGQVVDQDCALDHQWVQNEVIESARLMNGDPVQTKALVTEMVLDEPGCETDKQVEILEYADSLIADATAAAVGNEGTPSTQAPPSTDAPSTSVVIADEGKAFDVECKDELINSVTPNVGAPVELWPGANCPVKGLSAGQTQDVQIGNDTAHVRGL